MQFPKAIISHDLVFKCLNNELDDDDFIYNNSLEQKSANNNKKYDEIPAIDINKYRKTL